MASQDAATDSRWKAFGAWITERQGSLSDRELGRRVKLSPTQIGAIKRGESGTKPDKIILIAHALGATEQEAYAALGMSAGAGMSAQMLEMAMLLNGLAEKQQRALINITRAGREAILTVAG